MDEDGFVWGEAEVTHPDWKGTAQLDQRMTGPDAILATAVGLDPKKWHVIGFDIGGGETDHHLRIIAVPLQDVVEGEGHDALGVVANPASGEIVATEFLIHNLDPYEFLRRVTHVFELRMRPRWAVDRQIRVMSRYDVPDMFLEEFDDLPPQAS